MRKLLPAALLLLVAAACNPDDVVHKVGWFATMRHQRSIKPYAMPRPSPTGSIPVTGHDPDSLSVADANRLVNPRTRTSESLNQGKWVYETYCQVCHGVTGRGDGPVSMTGGGPFIGVRSLVTDTMAKKPDGYIYGVMVYALPMGRGLMPRYGDKVRGNDRWDLVNYIRSLQVAAKAGGKR
jgi:mono/diheme cytochrome c family protein